MDNKSNLKKKKEKNRCQRVPLYLEVKTTSYPINIQHLRKNLKFDTMNGDQNSNTIQHELTALLI
jgi:hypothetical protein